MQAELVQTRKEYNATIKQLNEIVVRMAEKGRYSLPQTVSSHSTTKVIMSQYVYHQYWVHNLQILPDALSSSEKWSLVSSDTVATLKTVS